VASLSRIGRCGAKWPTSPARPLLTWLEGQLDPSGHCGTLINPSHLASSLGAHFAARFATLFASLPDRRDEGPHKPQVRPGGR